MGKDSSCKRISTTGMVSSKGNELQWCNCAYLIASFRERITSEGSASDNKQSSSMGNSVSDAGIFLLRDVAQNSITRFRAFLTALEIGSSSERRHSFHITQRCNSAATITFRRLMMVSLAPARYAKGNARPIREITSSTDFILCSSSAPPVETSRGGMVHWRTRTMALKENCYNANQASISTKGKYTHKDPHTYTYMHMHTLANRIPAYDSRSLV